MVRVLGWGGWRRFCGYLGGLSQKLHGKVDDVGL